MQDSPCFAGQPEAATWTDTGETLATVGWHMARSGTWQRQALVSKGAFGGACRVTWTSGTGSRAETGRQASHIELASIQFRTLASR